MHFFDLRVIHVGAIFSWSWCASIIELSKDQVLYLSICFNSSLRLIKLKYNQKTYNTFSMEIGWRRNKETKARGINVKEYPV